MKPVIKAFVIVALLMVSCYKPYHDDAMASQKVLVVNGMITNEPVSYHVRLSYATQFDSLGPASPLTSARVTVTDNHGNLFFFNDRGDGDYLSDSLQFKSRPGNLYTLNITTPDGERYESDPQKLLVEVPPDSVYAEYDNQETLSKITGMMALTHGADILIDIKNRTDALPHFLIKTNLVRQYFYTVCPLFQSCYLYYCWQTTNANTDINLTDEGFALNSASVTRHAICFIDDNLNFNALTYGLGHQQPDMSYVGISNSEYGNYMVHTRIIYLKQYAINNETYVYYKGMQDQLLSNGKLFDPIAVQLNGNIRCVTDAGKSSFGFFEASSVSSSAYIIDFKNPINGQPSVRKTPYILPSEPNGSLVNKAPPFWVLN
jgi:hypothetical protein